MCCIPHEHQGLNETMICATNPAPRLARTEHTPGKSSVTPHGSERAQRWKEAQEASPSRRIHVSTWLALDGGFWKAER